METRAARILIDASLFSLEFLRHQAAAWRNTSGAPSNSRRPARLVALEELIASKELDAPEPFVTVDGLT